MLWDLILGLKTLVFVLVFSPLACPLHVIARTQTCAITYGKAERDSYEDQIDKRAVIDDLEPIVCYQIGDEYDSHGKLIKGKPIFACCQSDNL